MTQTIDAIYEQGVLKPLAPLKGVQEHSQVRLTIETNGAKDSPHPPGSIAAMLHAVRQPPFASIEDVEVLERAIEEGKLPVREEGIFDSDT